MVKINYILSTDVHQGTTNLNQSLYSTGAMLTIGRSNYMRFNHPAEAKLMKAVLPNARISMAAITFEVDNNYQPKFNKKPPVAPRRSPRESFSDDDAPSSFMTKVSKFEYLAAQNFKKSISPKVPSAPDLQTFAKNLPQSALNYSELNPNEKQKVKTPYRQIFGRKSPNYVNVTLNETKTINNRVIIYENGCVPKSQNLVNCDQHSNDLNNVNNKNQNLNKTVNVSRTTTPSPNLNRNQSPFNRSLSGSPVCNNNLNQKYGECELSKSVQYIGVSGSLENLAQRKNEAELRRNQFPREAQANLESPLIFSDMVNSPNKIEYSLSFRNSELQNRDSDSRKPTPIKFILPLEFDDSINQSLNFSNISNSLNETSNSEDKFVEKRDRSKHQEETKKSVPTN
ncbi:pleckstrin y-like domain family b member 3 [Holotrichia oblita]|uniref:Pleckstrin y-like domain family b member 3 n=1 Tax=Holotrichia oblita TaxID=644536 RepID=A0ACB9TYM6_HOLOL|nr:pleckstrin y-like domain family b member 3 [Holotrichia oblita]